MRHSRILILDFGSQYTQLIARRVREIGVYCEIHPCQIYDETIRDFHLAELFYLAGLKQLQQNHTPRAPEIVFTLGCPVLGICYGMQTMAAQLGGKV